VPPPSLETSRLLLRPLTLADLDELATLHAEESFWHFPFRRGLTRDETRAFIERQIESYDTYGMGLMAAIDRRSGALTGWLGLATPHWLPEVLPAVEVGWRLGRRWWGRGFATEGGAASLRDGFERLGLDEIISIYDPENVASRAVMDRLGLRFQHATTHPVMGNTLHVHSISRSRWQQLAQQDPET
jgi:RimJ/RimL family protein N-acetyltransferase